MVIIGISGFVGSGKTTVSDWFLQNHGFKRASFADPIRAMVMALGIPEETLRDPVKKEQPHDLLMGRSPRFAMETLGGLWGRETMHPQFWVGHFGLKALKMKFVIVDDVRYPNEVEAIHELGGKVFKLIVPGREPRVASDHAVETVVPDFALDNDFERGGVTTKALYGFIYDVAFQVPPDRARPAPGRPLEAWTGCTPQAKAEAIAALARAPEIA